MSLQLIYSFEKLLGLMYALFRYLEIKILDPKVKGEKQNSNSDRSTKKCINQADVTKLISKPSIS